MENKFPLKQCIIIGGGYSITEEGIPLGLWDKIRNKFTIGCNQSFNHFISTVQCFVDRDYFEIHKEELYRLPLVIGNSFGTLTEETENLFTFKSSCKYYGKDSFKKGYICRATLVGLWCLTIAICLGAEEIYCLGYDWSKRSDKRDEKTKKVLTHYYQKDEKLKHRGVGKTVFYDDHNPKQYFEDYLKEPIKICIVGKTNLKLFENIGYPVFFQRIKNSPDQNQPELRKWIKNKIKTERPTPNFP